MIAPETVQAPASSASGRYHAIALASSIGLIVALATWSGFPALMLGRTAAHGDIATLDLPFFDLLARVVRGQASPFWSSQILGGHPIFAEGQFGLAHPLNLVWAAIVTPVVGPVYSMNLFHWLLKIIGGIGVVGLCRTLGASLPAATFAALTVVFAPIWQFEQYVLPVFEALTWIPWSLWALEVWAKRPTVRSSIAVAGASALVLLSGYPQSVHGLLVYCFVSFLVVPFQAEQRRQWIATWRPRLALALAAGVLFLGFVAVQILPTIELVGLSHRDGGIDMPFGGLIPLKSYIRGFLVTVTGSTPAYFPGTGSLLVFALATIACVIPVPARVKGHMIAAVVLLLLGFEKATPIFRFVYDYHLIPGLHFFRQMVLYIAISAIGVAVAVAFAIDWLCRQEFWRYGIRDAASRYWRWLAQPSRYVTRPSVLIVIALWIGATLVVQYRTVLAIHVGFELLAIVAVVTVFRIRREHLATPALCAVLTLEIISLRLHPWNFFDPSIFARPPAVAAIQSVPDWREYKMMTMSPAGLLAFVPTKSPDFPERVRKAYAAISPHTNMLWDLPSMNANLALALRRSASLDEHLRQEISGRAAASPGLRVIDLLGIRFVTNSEDLSSPAFRTLYWDDRPELQTDDNLQQVIIDNTAARPRFQVYTRCQRAASMPQALAAVENLKTRMLVLETLAGAADLSALCNVNESDAASQLNVRMAADTGYRLQMISDRPAWLFLADANYPGWTATVDGQSVPVYSAQVLGKAVHVPSGTHEIALTFVSRSFWIGLSITLVSVLLALVGAVIAWRRPGLSGLK